MTTLTPAAGTQTPAAPDPDGVSPSAAELFAFLAAERVLRAARSRLLP